MGKHIEKNKNRLKNIVIAGLVVLMAIFNASIIGSADAAEDQIEETQEKIESIEKKLEKEQQALNTANSSYTKVTSQINTTANLIKQTAAEISRKEAEIKNLEDRLELYKKMLVGYLQEAYFSDQDPVVRLAVADQGLDGIFGNADRMISAEEKMLGIMDGIIVSQEELGKAKSELADKKEDHEDLLQKKKSEQKEIAGDIQEARATIAELQKKLNELRSALSSFLGKSYNAKDINDAVAFASKVTGVRREYLQAELIVETGYGTFTGGCTYKNIRMKKADVDEFLKLAEELSDAYGGDYKKKKLSCSPSWGGYGGAMGVAQFMPTTWIGYKATISSMTGHKPPDPWNLTDGIVGMAKKLANAGATSKSGEFVASKRYYCGGPSSPYWKTKCEEYAKKVQYFSKDPESHI